MSSLLFSASIVPGAKRGRRIGTPTLNLALADVPLTLTEGVHACFAKTGAAWHPAVLFYGPRPVFDGTRACEVHYLNEVPEEAAATIVVATVAFLRPVQNFPSVEALKEQIRRDIEEARAMLASHALPPETAQEGDS